MYPRIRDLREDSDKLQKEIADYLGVSRSAYGKYETGRNSIPIDKLIMLADLYKVSVDYLLGETQDPKRFPLTKEAAENRLCIIRKKHKLNQTQIAEKINMSQMGYSKYETGRILLHPMLLIKLARFYNVSIDYLLGLTDVEERYE